jgi:hypothetical protein
LVMGETASDNPLRFSFLLDIGIECMNASQSRRIVQERKDFWSK